LFPAQPKTAWDARKRHDVVPDGGIAEVRNHIRGHEHIDRRANLMQAAKDVERVMLESGEWLRCKQKVKGYSVRHNIATSHSRKLAEQRGCKPSRAFARNAQAPHAARASTRAHVLTRECAASGWTAQLRAQVTVQLTLRASTGQPC
jgi:hypothetical protein